MSDPIQIEDDLKKVLAYEVNFIREAQSELVRNAQIIIDQAINAERYLDRLAQRLDRLCAGEGWHGEIDPLNSIERDILKGAAKLIDGELIPVEES